MNVEIDVHPEKNHRILVTFPYNPGYVEMIKFIDGAEFTGKEKPHGPSWHVPLLLGVCHDLRDLFGSHLRVGEGLKGWYRTERDHQQEMLERMEAEDAELTRLPDVLPELASALRDYQRSATVFGAHAGNFLIADQPGLGKTLETIAAIYEGGTEGATLIMAPSVSLKSVWEREILKWGSGHIYVMEKEMTKVKRERVVDAFMDDDVEVKWLLMNPEAIRPRRIKRDPPEYNAKGEMVFDELPSYPAIVEYEWDNMVIDECHKGAIRNPKTITAKTFYAMNTNRRIALSGTPMKNRPSDLWGTLHWLEPEQYSSRWAWIKRFCEVTNDGWGSKIGGIMPHREEELQRSLAKIMIRRTKKEVYSELPEKMYIHKWVDMTPTQARLYKQMELEAKVKLQDMEVSATNVLSEFLRLKQFAAARYEASAIDGDPITPTTDSGKLNMMDEILEERDVYEGWEPAGEKVVVFSQFSQLVMTAARHSAEKGARVAVITGGFSGYIRQVKHGRKKEIEQVKATREDIMERFQENGGPNVIFITTSAGGVAITLDRASTAIFLDEMWSPADMEQAEDRVHRASRIHQVIIYIIRSNNTIDEYISNLVSGKADAAKSVLDAWRSGTLRLG